MVFVEGKRHVARTHLPTWFIRSGAGIFEFELVAVLLALCLAIRVAPGRSVLACCDNMGARGAVIRGSCNTVLGRALSGAFWLVAARFAVSVWIEFVRSASNPCDPPSRMCPLTDKPAPAEGEPGGVPRLFFDIIESRDALFRARFARLSKVMVFLANRDAPVRGM